MVDSNLQRDKILPSEKAIAYKMKYDALKDKINLSPMETSQLSESRAQIYRYIRLNNLISELLQLVDDTVLKDKRSALTMGLRPAVELSYLSKENKEFKLLELDKEENKYRKLLDEIKEDYKNNYISKNDLDIFKDRYMYELNNIMLEKENLNNNEFNYNRINKIKEIKKIGKLDCIDRNAINELIDVIYIGENKNIEVIFKYKNLYENAIRYLNL